LTNQEVYGIIVSEINEREESTMAIKCPKCGSVEPFYIEDVSFDYDETIATVTYSYKCCCGRQFSTITVYVSELGEQLIEDEEE
jgi:DNA-directed RNA polymerase subunit RPC12/RpoP